MLFFVVCSIFIGVPIAMQLRAASVAEGSAASALLIGTACGLISFWRENWAIGLLAFFLAAFVGFAVAYIVGLVFRLFGINQKFGSEVNPSEVPERRQLIGGIGAIAIPSTVLLTALAHWWQTGSWASVPLRPLLGLSAFLVLGLATVVAIYFRRRRRSRSAL